MCVSGGGFALSRAPIGPDKPWEEYEIPAKDVAGAMTATHRISHFTHPMGLAKST